MKRLIIVATLFLAAASGRATDSIFPPSASAIPSMPDAAHIELSIRKLGMVGRVLYVGAHPDDENTAMLAYLENGRLVRTAYLSMNRGDGGQNLIGNEKGDLLGVIRTQELLAARRVDGAEQFFTRAIDFGYSKNPEETLRIWGHDRALADVVWIFRLFRPDVVVDRFPKSGAGGHGHHTASAILAEEAFHAAADPKAFPEQLRYVSTWQAKRILWNSWTPPGQTPPPGLLTVDLGAYNPLLGKSYTEIAADSRSMHKSQGNGSPERRGSQLNNLEMVAGDPATSDLLDGVDTTWSRVPGGAAIGSAIDAIVSAFDSRNPAASIPALVSVHHLIAAIPESDPWVTDVKREKLRAVSEVIREAAGLWTEAISRSQTATPGSDVHITATLVNRCKLPFRLESVTENGSPVNITAGELRDNQPWTTDIVAHFAPSTPISQPYWLVDPPDGGMYHVADPLLVGRPENASPVEIRFTISLGDEKIDLDVPTLYRWTDRVRGEQYSPLFITPDATLNLDEKVYAFSSLTARKVSVLAQSHRDALHGTVHLDVPAGWSVTPASAPLDLPKNGDEATLSFQVRPPAAAGEAVLHAVFTGDGVNESSSLDVIDYAHIPEQMLFPNAEAPLLRINLQHRGERVGYIMGAGDEVPDSLEQMGYGVTMLTDDQLDNGRLDQFDAIVVGVRAFNMRDRVKKDIDRLDQYVERGGTLVVQYNTADDTIAAKLGPYPFKVSRDRVTVEEAPVTFVAPDNPLLNEPNRITQADFDGWIQERGIYFPVEWDSHYQTVISSHDPGEKDLPGGILYLKYGKGIYIYTGYDFFRELPAGVPGAWRLFANMVSAGKNAKK